MSEAVLSAFQGYLEQEIKRRNMSLREFATYVGLHPSVISRLMDKSKLRTPELPTLYKIASATGADLLTLVGMIYPDSSDIDIESRQRARRIANLPPEDQAAVDALLAGLAVRSQKSQK